MPTLTDVFAGLTQSMMSISAAAQIAAADVASARDELQRYGETASGVAGGSTTSSMPSGGGRAGGMGASSGGLGNGNATMTTRGMAGALTIARRSL